MPHVSNAAVPLAQNAMDPTHDNPFSDVMMKQIQQIIEREREKWEERAAEKEAQDKKEREEKAAQDEEREEMLLLNRMELSEREAHKGDIFS